MNRLISIDRMHALTDGVFAIVLTLLVILIEPPEGGLSRSALLADIAGKWHMIVAYVTSFILIGIYWWRHHLMFHHLERANLWVLWLNLLFLMTVAFVPFPTALLVSYLDTPGAGEVSLVIFNSIHLICTLLLLALWMQIRKILSPNPDDDQRWQMLLFIWCGIFVLSLAACLLHRWLAMLLLLAVPILNFLPWAPMDAPTPAEE
ncbi:MAG: DUF1211 domain-containing protein [Proteobacteria bacterium]|jgi:uncharacterized membrane protein|nr:DUF1211 domain-containing protein [Pseudomonadota bacterium]